MRRDGGRRLSWLGTRGYLKAQARDSRSRNYRWLSHWAINDEQNIASADKSKPECPLELMERKKLIASEALRPADSMPIIL